MNDVWVLRTEPSFFCKITSALNHRASLNSPVFLLLYSDVIFTVFSTFKIILECFCSSSYYYLLDVHIYASFQGGMFCQVTFYASSHFFPLSSFPLPIYIIINLTFINSEIFSLVVFLLRSFLIVVIAV